MLSGALCHILSGKFTVGASRVLLCQILGTGFLGGVYLSLIWDKTRKQSVNGLSHFQEQTAILNFDIADFAVCQLKLTMTTGGRYLVTRI